MVSYKHSGQWIDLTSLLSLNVFLLGLFRLFILGSYDRETYVHCTLELSSHQWKEKARSSIKKVKEARFITLFSMSVRHRCCNTGRWYQ